MAGTPPASKGGGVSKLPNFDIHNVVVVNGRAKLTGLGDDNGMLGDIRNGIGSMLINILNSWCGGLEINQHRDFLLLIWIVLDGIGDYW